MKRFLLYLFAVATLVACTKGDDGESPNPNPDPTPSKPKAEIKIETTASDFTAEGGKNKISFTTTEAWTAEVINSRADGWCSISPTSGAAGSATISVTTEPNDTPDDRSASIVIKAGSASKTVKVSQKQKDALTVTASTFEVAAEGGEVKIEVKANIDFEYAIDESAQEWISYEGTRAMKTSTLTFSVDKNDDTEKREGKIAIKSGEFNEVVTIYQAGSEPLIVISQNEYVVSSDGETISVEVSSNVDVEVEMPADADWISENTTRAASTNTYRFDIQPNEDYDQRTAEIKFTNKENGLSEVVVIKQMQRDAIVLADSKYEFGIDGGNLDFEIQTNVDVTVAISEDATDWIKQVETRGLETKALYFNVAACSAEEDREGTITISGGNATQTITVKQSGIKEILEKEREALIAFYNATGGDNWTCNDNWCSDKPIEEWYGITVENGVVTNIDLRNNNLSGVISNELNKIISLKELNIDSNHLTSITLQNCPSLEAIICNNNKLTTLDVAGNESLGTLQCNDNTLESISLMSCKNLHTLFCENTPLKSLDLSDCVEMQQLNICYNKLTSLDISSCPKLFTLDCSGNQLSTLEVVDKSDLLYLWCRGNLLENLIVSNCERLITCLCDFNNIQKLEIENCPNIETLWCHQNSLDELDVTSYTKLKNLWCGNYDSFEGNKISTLDISQNTLLEEFSCYGMKLTTIDVSNNPHLWSFECSGNPITSLDLSSLVNLKELWCHSMDLSDDLDVSTNVELEWLCCFNNPNLAKIIISNEQVFSYKKDETTKFCIKGSDVLYDEFPYYASTDYSKDGEVKQLQSATKGNGIDIVLMGDAYSDRLIADGTYDMVMNTAMEKFFMEEPYKSYRDNFNVYSVTAVSENEVYNHTSSTAFAGYFGGETLVGGNDTRVFSYAQKAIGAERMDDALIVVMMNSEAYAGTCYMYSPTDNGDWGDGVSISYFPVGVDDNALAQVLHHEAGGHGFSKLGDEYAYEEMGNVPEWEIESARTMATYGWWKNVDFTNDPTKVKWSTFLSDARYANDGLGVFEGAFTYWTGAYRPTNNSIMNTNVGGFNAPSREAIYYRIHKLAYGEDWEYDYEEFVEWDARNRNTASATRGVPYRLDIPEDFKPLHAPVVMKTSWRNAKNNAPAKKPVTPSGKAGRNSQKASLPSMATAPKSMTATKTIKLPDGTTRTITTSASGATQTTYGNNAKN